MGELNATQVMADTFLRLVVVYGLQAGIQATLLTLGALVVLFVIRLTGRKR